jgi:uncharacterized protein (DUF1501 family)
MKNTNINTDISRRNFIEKLAYGTLGVSIMQPFSCGAENPNSRFGKAKRIIYLFLNGGASHLDTFDPKTNPETSTGIKGIKTTGEFEITEHFPKLAQHGKNFSVIRSMTSQTGAHAQGQYLVRSSYPKNSLTLHPTMGALSYWLLGKQHGSIPDNILISGDTDHSKGGYLDKKFYPLSIVNPTEGLRYGKSSVSDSVFSKRMQILNSLNSGFGQQNKLADVSSYNTFYDETLKLMSSSDLDLFDLNKEDKETRERYGMNQLGQGLLLAKRLIKNNVRFVEVDNGGYDMHVDINDRMADKAMELDTALAALFDDLESDGLIKETLVVIATEFGRTPTVNVNQGRDHSPGAFSCVIGGLDLGGKVIGKTDEKGAKVVDRPVSIGEFNATIGHLIGIKHDHIWTSNTGRPFSTGNNSKPLPELIS